MEFRDLNADQKMLHSTLLNLLINDEITNIKTAQNWLKMDKEIASYAEGCEIKPLVIKRVVEKIGNIKKRIAATNEEHVEQGLIWKDKLTNNLADFIYHKDLNRLGV
jgi:hypothetical protein